MDKEELYRAEFEEWYLSIDFPRLGNIKINEMIPIKWHRENSTDYRDMFKGYIAGRKKGDEYIERLEKELSLYDDDVRDFNKKIQELKEELKLERDCVDFYAEGLHENNLFDDESFVWGKGELKGKRARSVQAQRKII